MKKIALILVLCMIYMSTGVLAASDMQSGKTNLPQGMPKTISLLDTTPLYAEPSYDFQEPLAKLSPQDVEVVSTHYGDQNYASPLSYTWVQIHTSWLGDLWIKVENRKLGVIRPLDLDIQLGEETPLYNLPYSESLNGASLSPQNVHAKAEFVSPSGFYAIQIETSWLGDQWLLQPNVSSGIAETLSFPTATSPDYDKTMLIKNIQVVKLGERTFVKGDLVLQKEAWERGRAKPWGEVAVSGKLAFMDMSGKTVSRVPYAIWSKAGESLESSLFLPVNVDLSSAVVASLQDTFPLYFGLPLPPLLNLTDPDGKVLVGILRHYYTGDYSVARAWISGKLPGKHTYELTLNFYSEDNQLLGTAHVTQLLHGPESPDQAGDEGGGTPYSIDIVGQGDWTKYTKVTVKVDKVSDHS